jgi:hypothetical protein
VPRRLYNTAKNWGEKIRLPLVPRVQRCGDPRSLVLGFFMLRRFPDRRRSYLDCWRMWRQSREIPRFFCTLPRSGTGYMTSLITSAWEMRNGLDGEYQFGEGGWQHTFKPRVPTSCYGFVHFVGSGRDFPPFPWWSAHFPMQHADMFDPSRVKTVFTVRNLLHAFESWANHTTNEKYQNRKWFIDFKLGQMIRYFNYWGEFQERHPDKCLGVKYEEITREPVPGFLAIDRFWNLGISPDIWARAAALHTKEEMLKRIPQERHENNDRVSLEAKKKMKFDEPELVERIQKKIGRELRYRFGYSL